jgi:hypothetical protein
MKIKALDGQIIEHIPRGQILVLNSLDQGIAAPLGKPFKVILADWLLEKPEIKERIAPEMYLSRETLKALLLTDSEGSGFWLPKSQIIIEEVGSNA